MCHKISRFQNIKKNRNQTQQSQYPTHSHLDRQIEQVLTTQETNGNATNLVRIDAGHPNQPSAELLSFPLRLQSLTPAREKTTGGPGCGDVVIV